MSDWGPGWGFPGRSNKAHYFPASDDSRSLCQKWGFFMGNRDDDNHESPDNCAECKRKRLNLLKKSETSA